MRRIVVLLCALGLAVTGALTATGTAAAANPYDLQSPYRDYGGWTCADTQEIISAQYLVKASGRVNGAVQLRHSKRCDTYWAYVKMYHTIQQNFFATGSLYRYYNGSAGSWNCGSPGGNGAITPNRSQCNTGMIYAPSSAVTFIAVGAEYWWNGSSWEQVSHGQTARCNQHIC